MNSITLTSALKATVAQFRVRMASLLAIVCLATGTACTPVEHQSPPLSIEGLPLGDNYPYASPIAVVAAGDGGSYYVGHHTGRSVEALDANSGDRLWLTSLPTAVSGLVLDERRNLLYVAHGLENGRITAIKTDNGAIAFDFTTGHTPSSPVLSADGNKLYVCNRFNNEVAAYDLETGALAASVRLAREPIAAALTPDGGMLVVARHLPTQPSNARHVAAGVDLIDTATFELGASVVLPSGSTSVMDVCISPDGKFAYVTHVLARFHLPTTQVDRGWMNTSALSVIDLGQGAALTTVLLDDIERGAANPWGVACSADGRTLVVSHAGTHELSIINRLALHEKIARVAAGGEGMQLMDIPNKLGFLGDMRERVALPGKGPRGLTMTTDAVIVSEYFSDSLAIVSLNEDDASRSIRRMGAATTLEANEVRRGELAFYDAQHCFQAWQSCSSCHPGTRMDGLNWDLLNDGIGNPKNTRTMLNTHATPPVMITGIRASAEVAVRAGFRFIQFVQVPEETTAAVDAYLKAMQPVPSPYLVDGKLSVAAIRGREIFNKAGCIHCHSGPYHTDGKMYYVGTGPDQLGLALFITPSLVEIWRTAPYLYDGRATTIMEVLTKFNEGDYHGKTSDLTEEQLADLAEYVLSL